MHSGLNKIVLSILIVLFIASCKEDSPKYSSFSFPSGNDEVKQGAALKAKIDFNTNQIDSVVYSIDSTILAVAKDTASVSLATAQLRVGSKVLFAKIYTKGDVEEVSTNVRILPANAIKQYGYKVVKSFPHDTDAYTQGLEFKDGILYESTGEYEHSTLRKVELNTGKVLKMHKLENRFFAEGMTIVGDKIYQLTWQERTAFVYNKADLSLLKTLTYNVSNEGWGLCYDGKSLISSDGSHMLYFLNPEDMSLKYSLEVMDDKGPVKDLNEMEYVEGKIYANRYQSNELVIIDPKTGVVEARVNLTGLLPQGYFTSENDILNNVLNGIAYDAPSKRLFVTGKKWPHLFQIELIAQ